MTDITTRLAQARREIAIAARRAGREPDSVRLVAVSKTHPAGAVETAAATGQRIFGENRVQEAREKIPACPPGLEWHLLGHLQKNKVRQALSLFSFFHSIDSQALAGATASPAKPDKKSTGFSRSTFPAKRPSTASPRPKFARPSPRWPPCPISASSGS
jgi:uncharacterized pyridoxal phosphate-containing UPF0001 family protein